MPLDDYSSDAPQADVSHVLHRGRYGLGFWWTGEGVETSDLEVPEHLGRLVLVKEAEDVIWQLKQTQMPGDDGVILACLAKSRMLLQPIASICHLYR